ncbi:MAG: SGNH/GDSL hydrolase family protein [Chloroflexi bacterium]|nr:MAG: SGNH/GDSL hydrolase family protein [Chloroflexota bacterium]
MKPNHRLLLIVGTLSIVLLASLALNYSLFSQGRQFYLQLNWVRLDPLGLGHYSTEPEQSILMGTDRTTVVFFGDSRAESWPPPTLPQFHFVNRGIAAETSVQTLQRFDYHVKPLRPDVVVVQVGVNDLDTITLFPDQREAIVANCQENIRQIVKASTDLGARVVLTTIFPTGRVPLEWIPFWSDDVSVALEEVNAFLRSLEGEDVTILDSYALLLGDDGSTRPEYSQDLLHLNAAGYRRLNDALVPILEEEYSNG